MKSELAKMTGPSQLEITRILPATCERVWEYITNAELRQKWFCAGETGSQPGEPFEMDFDHSRISTSSPPEGIGCGKPVVMRGEIVQFNPPHILSYRWPGNADEEESLVTIELTQVGDHTRLHLIHSQLSQPEIKLGASAGWHAHLDLLVDLTNGCEARDFWVHYEQVKAEYELQTAK